MDITALALDSLASFGASHSSARFTESSKYEMNIENGEMSLLRTIFDRSLSLTAIKDGREGTASLNLLTEENIKNAAREAVLSSENANFDPANGISPYAAPEKFTRGPIEPDRELMYTRAQNFLNDVKAKYPSVSLRTLCLSHTKAETKFVNSNGVDFSSLRGYYTASVTVVATDGAITSSFNYTGFLSENLDREILDSASIRRTLDEIVLQTATKSAPGTFTGDIIFSPDCLDSILDEYIGTFLSDSPLIAGTSPMKDKLNQKIASDKLTVESDLTLAGGYFVTDDGFKAESRQIIENGVLKTFPIGRYASEKTGLPNPRNEGGAYRVKNGDASLDDIIKSTEKGLLVCRFSGGAAAKNGDVSGLAKNSFYIEKGKIKYALSETMIAGNLASMFENIAEISRETVDFGYCVLPYIKINNVKIIGK